MMVAEVAPTTNEGGYDAIDTAGDLALDVSVQADGHKP
jgi:hypothetical protein